MTKNQLLSEMETPRIVIDREKLLANISLVQNIANSHDLVLRPHIKTHKCLEIAKLQLKQGAVGITASKTDEALVFAKNGFSSITLAYPLVVESKANRLVEYAQSYGTEIRLIVDSKRGLDIISRAAKKYDRKIGIFLKIDVGYHRCGLEEDDPLLFELAEEISKNPHLDFLGLLSHAGQVYEKSNREEAYQVAVQENKILMSIRRELEKCNIPVKEISIGSTPTVLASDCYEGITEIRPGNYIFLDRTPLRLNLIQPSQISLSVLATVVSKNKDYFIIDAGSKVLSASQEVLSHIRRRDFADMQGVTNAHSPLCKRGTTQQIGKRSSRDAGKLSKGGFSSDIRTHGTSETDYGIVYPFDQFLEEGQSTFITKLSEEHGIVKRANFDLKIGDKVRILPNHACVVANLTNNYCVVEKNEVIGEWKLIARGQVL